jgi:hypothetical protein
VQPQTTGEHEPNLSRTFSRTYVNALGVRGVAGAVLRLHGVLAFRDLTEVESPSGISVDAAFR